VTNSREACREISRALSGYLCGTESGLLARTSSGRRRGQTPEKISAAHRAIRICDTADHRIELGHDLWEPDEGRELVGSLRRALTQAHVVELVFFGSQARGARTGFSDVDAVLVIADEAADDPAKLRSLRTYVVAAQRAVLRHQPMQHHGFEVATPRLLVSASEALALPAIALSETRSLNGRAVHARVANGSARGRSTLADLVRSLRALAAWPHHPWQAHRVVSMFELLPTLYLQSVGSWVAKSRSFSKAREHFSGDWWAYDVLNDVRRCWPRQRYPLLEHAVTLLRNPWAAVALWRRLPEPLPANIQTLLTPELLRALQSLSWLMGVEAV
jgi:hypothetical protein